MDRVVEIPRMGYDPRYGKEDRTIDERLEESNRKIKYLLELMQKRAELLAIEREKFNRTKKNHVRRL